MIGFTYAFQNYKLIGDYSDVVHKIYAKLQFCEKEPSDEEKIEKTLTTILPSDRVLKHQYRARNYQHYSEFVQYLLQAKKYDKLIMKN
jgi:hypothetical protein